MGGVIGSDPPPWKRKGKVCSSVTSYTLKPNSSKTDKYKVATFTHLFL